VNQPHPITSNELKRYWRQCVTSGGFQGSYRSFLRAEARRASDQEGERREGRTYADAAWLLLERK
jgi:hypothetical protein